MKILSLFDGCSCGMVALKRLGHKNIEYYASEVDKYAIQISRKNHPEITHIGDVKKVNGKDYIGIDLLMGGSPCQGFSFAGKQLNFDDPRSTLFFEFVRILRESKPKYFLLENVRMKKECVDVISKELGVKPIVINSSLVSAQNRHRLYRTNIPGIEQPEDRGLLIKDVLDDTPYKTYRVQVPIVKTKNYHKYDISGKGYYSQQDRAYYLNGKIGTVPSCGASNKMNVETGVKGVFRRLSPVECERLQTLPDNYTEGVSDTQRYKMIGNGRTVDVIKHIFSYIK